MTERWNTQKDVAENWFRQLRDKICAEFEAIEANLALMQNLTIKAGTEPIRMDPPVVAAHAALSKARYLKRRASISPAWKVHLAPNLPRPLMAQIKTRAFSPLAFRLSRIWPIRMFPLFI